MKFFLYPSIYCVPHQHALKNRMRSTYINIGSTTIYENKFIVWVKRVWYSIFCVLNQRDFENRVRDIHLRSTNVSKNKSIVWTKRVWYLCTTRKIFFYIYSSKFDNLKSIIQNHRWKRTLFLLLFFFIFTNREVVYIIWVS